MEDQVKVISLTAIIQVIMLLVLSVNLLFSGYTYIKGYRTQRFEYSCVYTDRDALTRDHRVWNEESESWENQRLSHTEYLDSHFSKMGAQGWEMVGYAMNDGVNARFVCFKRPL